MSPVTLCHPSTSTPTASAAAVRLTAFFQGGWLVCTILLQGCRNQGTTGRLSPSNTLSLSALPLFAKEGPGEIGQIPLNLPLSKGGVNPPAPPFQKKGGLPYFHGPSTRLRLRTKPVEVTGVYQIGEVLAVVAGLRV